MGVIERGRPLDRPVVLHVGALELVGFPAGRRLAVTAAFERELGRLIRVRGLPVPGVQAAQPAPSHASPSHRPPNPNSAAPRGRATRIDPHGAPALAGRAIARAVYRSLG